MDRALSFFVLSCSFAFFFLLLLLSMCSWYIGVGVASELKGTQLSPDSLDGLDQGMGWVKSSWNFVANIR
jgi:hypothetical protein